MCPASCEYLIYIRSQLSCRLRGIQLYVEVFVIFKFRLGQLLCIERLMLRLMLRLLLLLLSI